MYHNTIEHVHPHQEHTLYTRGFVKLFSLHISIKVQQSSRLLLPTLTADVSKAPPLQEGGRVASSRGEDYVISREVSIFDLAPAGLTERAEGNT